MQKVVKTTASKKNLFHHNYHITTFGVVFYNPSGLTVDGGHDGNHGGHSNDGDHSGGDGDSDKTSKNINRKKEKIPKGVYHSHHCHHCSVVGAVVSIVDLLVVVKQ